MEVITGIVIIDYVVNHYFGVGTLRGKEREERKIRRGKKERQEEKQKQKKFKNERKDWEKGGLIKLKLQEWKKGIGNKSKDKNKSKAKEKKV
jgi:hypothetical protein